MINSFAAQTGGEPHLMVSRIFQKVLRYLQRTDYLCDVAVEPSTFEGAFQLNYFYSTQL